MRNANQRMPTDHSTSVRMAPIRMRSGLERRGNGLGRLGSGLGRKEPLYTAAQSERECSHHGNHYGASSEQTQLRRYHSWEHTQGDPGQHVTEASSSMFAVALLPTDKLWHQLSCSSAPNKQKMWYTGTIEFYSAIKKKRCHLQENARNWRPSKRGFTVSQMIPQSAVFGLTLFSRLSVLILHENRRQTTAGRGGD